MTAITTHPKDLPMTTHTASRPAIGPTRFRQVLAVEFRKAASTTASFALLAAIAGGIALVAVISTFAFTFFEDQGMPWFIRVAILMAAPGFLVPPAVILLSTAEWSTRSAMTTFTLVPRRSIVLAAKALVAAVIAISAWLLALGFGILSYVIGAVVHGVRVEVDMPWRLAAGDLGAFLLLAASALALGLLIQNAPAAIVVVLAVPNLISGLGMFAQWLDTLVLWTNLPNALYGSLQSAEPTEPVDWARLASAATIWIIVPGVLGWIRTLRREAS